MPDLLTIPVEVREAMLGRRHSCIDWQWAEGRASPRCRRNKSCGAMVPDSCPLAALRKEVDHD